MYDNENSSIPTRSMNEFGEVIAEAGYPDGDNFVDNLFETGDTDELGEAIAQLEEAGEAILDVTEGDTFSQLEHGDPNDPAYEYMTGDAIETGAPRNKPKRKKKFMTSVFKAGKKIIKKQGPKALKSVAAMAGLMPIARNAAVGANPNSGLRFIEFKGCRPETLPIDLRFTYPLAQRAFIQQQFRNVTPVASVTATAAVSNGTATILPAASFYGGSAAMNIPFIIVRVAADILTSVGNAIFTLAVKFNTPVGVQNLGTWAFAVVPVKNAFNAEFVLVAWVVVKQIPRYLPITLPATADASKVSIVLDNLPSSAKVSFTLPGIDHPIFESIDAAGRA